MESVNSYAAEVDRLLAAAVSVFPADPPALIEVRHDSVVPATAPGGVSGLADAVSGAAGDYHSADARASGTSDRLHDVLEEVAAQLRRDAAAASDIRHTAAAGAQAIVGEGQAPHNLVLLVTEMDGRVAAMQEQIELTQQRLAAAAQGIQEQGAQLAVIRLP